MASHSKKHYQQILRPLLHGDPLLKPYAEILRRRLKKVDAMVRRMTSDTQSLYDFAAGHDYFGLHFIEDQHQDGQFKKGAWVFREWAPNATAVYLIGEMNGWREETAFALTPVDKKGIWEIRLHENALSHGCLYRLYIHWPGGSGDRIPAYARRVVQDPDTLIFNAQVWRPSEDYGWKDKEFQAASEAPLIYEAHVGMAQEAEKIGSYEEFTLNILPRIIDAGYNTLQLMAIQEHPYYGSFGYQVSSFFAASSRFGTPEALKELIDAAHNGGLRVIMDLVHSHSVSNEVEGLSRFDGTPFQYFHDGPRGVHPAWDSRCFDYGKPQVIHFLLSNCRFWLEEYHFDGFRFDGVTSMLYQHHGLGHHFSSYESYFNSTVDEDGYAYLTLANQLIHDIRPTAITIAEDVSGMPGLGAPLSSGGAGFDYRFAMGIADNWIRLTKDTPDESWHMGALWHELTNKRKEEKTISYAESHDQALVGDQTLIFRLMGAEIYASMAVGCENIRVDRGMALHKLIRLITIATSDSYLNFMGNEFGHPDWIDFPREGNSWAFKYARRQWHLVDDDTLKYAFLARFDRDMIEVIRDYCLLDASSPRLLWEHDEDKVMAFQRAGLLFVFNFHPDESHFDYRFEVPAGIYQTIFTSDAPEYGGHDRLTPHQRHVTLPRDGEVRKEPSDNRERCHVISLYLPTRSAVVLEPVLGLAQK